MAAVGIDDSVLDQKSHVARDQQLTAVIAHYGDAARLAWAEQQAETLGLDALVYRGHATLALPRTTTARVVDAVGHAGMHAALELVGGPGDVVLHLHDDVALHPRGLAALVAAHQRTGHLVVPLVDERDVDHACDPLPPAMRAAGALDAATTGDPGTTTEAVTVSPACILGTRTQLLGLLTFKISFPGTVLNSVAADILAVPGAVAAHDGAETAFAHLEPEDGRPVLVASMIVRDEEAFLPGCLDSLDGVVDRIDVCDTGSTDATLDIMAERGIDPIERTWRDDFGWARNEVLELGRDAAWVLQVDADERLEVDDPALLRRVLRAAGSDFQALGVVIDDGGPGSTWGARWTSPRVFDPSIAHFVGTIHEEPRRRADGSTPSTGALPMVRLRHLGYAHAVVADRGKQERNLRISRAAWEADPSLENTLHYARSHQLADRPVHERVPMWEQVVRQLEGRSPRHQAYAGGMLASALNASGEPTAARAAARAALELVPRERVAIAAHAEASMLLDEPEAVLELLERCDGGPSLRPIFDDDHTSARIALAHVHALAATGGRLETIRDVAAAAITQGAATVDLWSIVLDVDAARATPHRTAGLVVSTGSAMGFRAFAERRDPASVVAMTERFLDEHDSEAVRAFGRRLAQLHGRDDLVVRWEPRADRDGGMAA